MGTIRTAGAILGAVLLFAPGTVSAQEDPSAAEALFVDTHKCNVCHAVAAAGIEHRSDKIAGPDLGGFTTDDVVALARYLRKEEARDDEEHKKTFRGEDEDLEAILAWLGGLDTVPE